MKKHLAFFLLSLFALILVILGIVYGLTFWQYEWEPSKKPILQTETTISSWTILREESTKDYSGFFTIDYLEQYSGALFILDLEQGNATVKIENRFEWSGEFFTLNSGERYSAFIDQRIKKYQNTIGITISPTDRKKGQISFKYTIIWKE